MILFLLAIIIPILIGIVPLVRRFCLRLLSKPYKHIKRHSFALCLFVFGISIGVEIILCEAISPILQTKTVIEKYDLVVLSDNNLTIGSFFLGCGKIEHEFTYSFYIDNGRGVDLITRNINVCNVVYTDSCKPYVKIVYKEIPNYSSSKNYIFCNKRSERGVIIYIPKGSIKTSINLDAN